MEESGTSEHEGAPASGDARPPSGPLARALRFWRLAIAGLIVGLVAGFAVSAGGDDEFEATASVYLGRPTAPVGQSQLQGLQTNPATVRQIVRSQATVEEVASELGLGVRRLRQGISTRVVSRAFGRRVQQSELVEIRVRGPWSEETAQAANRLATIVVDRVSGYVDTKIAGLETLRETQDAELASLTRRIEELANADPSLSPALRADYLDFARDRLARRNQVREDRSQTQAALTLAQEVERAQLVAVASAVTVTEPTSSRAIAIGAVVGLIVGAGVAFAAGQIAPVARRRAAGEAEAT